MVVLLVSLLAVLLVVFIIVLVVFAPTIPLKFIALILSAALVLLFIEL